MSAGEGPHRMIGPFNRRGRKATRPEGHSISGLDPAHAPALAQPWGGRNARLRSGVPEHAPARQMT
ncbi:hypothetical protein ACT6QG_14275 [Xanthobacter sp. TB0136]|uniref:hypothetical protein n=1 Tax=Xanthobacter sp. TB0136 TaxID=3459177 RepID=UPI004039CC13